MQTKTALSGSGGRCGAQARLISLVAGAEDPADVRSDQITSLLPRFMPGKRFKKSLEDIKFEKA